MYVFVCVNVFTQCTLYNLVTVRYHQQKKQVSSQKWSCCLFRAITKSCCCIFLCRILNQMCRVLVANLKSKSIHIYAESERQSQNCTLINENTRILRAKSVKFKLMWIYAVAINVDLTMCRFFGSFSMFFSHALLLCLCQWWHGIFSVFFTRSMRCNFICPIN